MHIDTPQLPKNLTTTSSPEEISGGSHLERRHIADVEAIGVKAPKLKAEESKLEKLTLIEAKLPHLRLTDVELRHSDLSAAICTHAAFVRVHVSGSRWAGADLSSSNFHHVVFEDCIFDMANLRAAKLQDVQFVGCHFAETDFKGADLRTVQFDNCTFDGAEFEHCKVKDVDLRDSALVSIQGWGYLKGAKIDTIQLAAIAPQLAATLGLDVQYDNDV